MHEWSLADAVVRSLLRFMASEGLDSIEEVEITWGEILELDTDIFERAFHELSRGTPLEGAKLVLREEKAHFRCNSCGAEWDFKTADEMLSREFEIMEEPTGVRENPLHFLPDLARTLLRCPRCGSRDFDLIDGKDLRVSRVVA